MFKRKDQEPMLPSSRILVGRVQLRLTYSALIALAASNLGLAGILGWSLTRDPQLYVVVTDSEATFSELAMARSPTGPIVRAMWRSAAQSWLQNIRERSLDPGDWPTQVRALVNTTDRSQWHRVDEWLAESTPTLAAAIDVEITEALVQESRDKMGKVFIRWRERQRKKDGGLDPWVNGSVLITLVKGPPVVEEQASVSNPFGVYVFGYEFNPLREGETS